MSSQNEKPINDIIHAFIRDRQMQDRLYQVRVLKLWDKLMGPAISQYTREIKLRKHTLYLTIEAASLRQELTYGREKIRTLLNEHLGEDYIESVIIR